MMGLQQEYEKALKIAMQFIQYRPRSVGEVTKKLFLKKTDPGIIDDVIKYLIEVHWLNDEDFARLWVDTRLNSRYYGPFRLTKELKLKKIDENLIIDTIEELYSEQPLEEWAFLFLQNKYRNPPEVLDEKKMIEILQRNGYDYHTALAALQIYKEKTEA